MHAPPADGLQRAYDAWAPTLVPALRTAPVWIDPSFASGLGPDFAEALSAAVADSPVDVRVAVGPEIERPPETDLTFYDRLVRPAHRRPRAHRPARFRLFHPPAAARPACGAMPPDRPA